MASEPHNDANGLDEQGFKPLTPEQASALRLSQPSLSPWAVILWQCVAGLVVALVAWGLSGQPAAFWSAGYGAMAVLIPAALFARGLMSGFTSFNAATATFGFFLWEAVKLLVSVVLIALAPRVVMDLVWPALVVGMLVTLKVYWVALRVRPKPKQILRV